MSTLMCNDGDWNFTDCSDANGLRLATPETNFQAAWGDYDNDGDLDLVTGRKLYRNDVDQANHWLMVEVRGNGTTVNSDGVGTQVRIDLGGGEILTRQVENATGWTNQNDPRLHFGLGAEAGPVDLDIVWPDGTTETIENVTVDQVVVVELLAGDYDNDGDIDLDDYAEFPDCMTGADNGPIALGCEAFDFDVDDDVDLLDFAEFQVGFTGS